MPTLSARQLRVRGLGPFDLEVPAGACVALTGPTGSGKTSLLRALADLDPHAGEVRLGAVAQADLAGPEWRRRVALLFASPTWWHDQVGPHFPSGRADAGTLAALALPPDALAWPVSRLSAGEAQRLALARLLARRPEALLLDEPTAHLDPAARARAENLIERYRREHAAPVLWVAHDASQVERVASSRIDLGAPS